jgi:hypothetical protein
MGRLSFALFKIGALAFTYVAMFIIKASKWANIASMVLD